MRTLMITAALLALADQPASPAAAAAIARALQDPMSAGDRWISDGAVCAAAKNATEFLQAAARVNDPSPGLTKATAITLAHVKLHLKRAIPLRRPLPLSILPAAATTNRLWLALQSN